MNNTKLKKNGQKKERYWEGVLVIVAIISAGVAIISVVVANNSVDVAKRSYDLNKKLVDSQIEQFETQNNLTRRTIELMNLQYDFEASPDVYFIIKPKKWRSGFRGEYFVGRDTFLSDPTIEIIVGNNGFKPIYIGSVSSYDDCSDVKGSAVLGLLGMQNDPIKPNENFIHTTDLLKNSKFDENPECNIYLSLGNEIVQRMNF